ncbi:hypothetical protein BDR26DRAFT_868519 [Obelidium mucronatum]|nr:hypothetical protein BDR26DRAFT_868519 [Obelidium mucronatum]
MERVALLNDIDDGSPRGTPESGLGLVEEPEEQQRLKGSSSSSQSSTRANSVASDGRDQEGDGQDYSTLWEEVEAVFGEAVERQAGRVDAFKCVYAKDEGTLFVTPSQLFFVPLEDTHGGAVVAAPAPKSSVSLARTQSLKQKFVAKKMSLAQTQAGSASASATAKTATAIPTPAIAAAELSLSGDDAESTSSNSLPRSAAQPARSSLDYNPAQTSLDSRRRSMFIKPSAAAAALAPATLPFHISNASITSVQKTRTMPMLMQPNAIQVECRNTSDNVFSHTSKHVFHGFTGGAKIHAIEKLIVVTVDTYREIHAKSVLKHGKKKTMSRRPSVGTSNLYTALTGKGADDYIHITSDAIIAGKELELEDVVKLAGPHSIKMQVAKSSPAVTASSISTTTTTVASDEKVVSKSKSRAILESTDASVAVVGKKNSVAPLPKSKPGTPQNGTPEPDDKGVSTDTPQSGTRSVPQSPLKQSQQMQTQPPKAVVSSPTSTTGPPPPVPPLPISKLKKTSDSSSSSTPTPSLSASSIPSSTASYSSTSSLSSLSSTLPIQLPRKEKSMSVLPALTSTSSSSSAASTTTAAGAAAASALQSRRLSRAQNASGSFSHSAIPQTLLDELTPPPRTASRSEFFAESYFNGSQYDQQQQLHSNRDGLATFSVYGTRFLVNFDRLVDVMLVGFGAVVLMVVVVDFWLIVRIVF